MGFDNSFQLLLFLYSLIFGVVLGAVYTGLSALRLFKPPSSLTVFIGWLCEYLTLGSLIKRFIKKKKKKT